MNTLRLIENALVVMLALIPVAVGQQTKPKCLTRPAGDGCNTCTSCEGQNGLDGSTTCTMAYCGHVDMYSGPEGKELHSEPLHGQQTKKPQTKVRIDWMTLGVHLPRIGECFQVVDDHEGGSELSQIACPAEPPKVEIVTDSAEEGTVPAEPQNQSIKPVDGSNWLPSLAPPCTKWDDKANAFVGIGHACIVTNAETVCTETRAAEPIDVPAIQETHEEEYGNYDWCNHCDPPDAGGMTSCTAMSCNPHAKHKVTVDTCLDKSRILLTAEDGSKHCIKFPSK